MRNLYNLLYVCLIAVAAPVLVYRRYTQGKYREGWSEKLWGKVSKRSGDRPCLWLHAVSVGEVLQIEPVVRGWQERHPEWDIYITTTTQTGMQVARRTYPNCQLSYCPLDFTWAVKAACDRIRPTCLALVELELWPNLLLEMHQRQISTVLINGRLSEKSFQGYRKLTWLIRPLLRPLRLVAAQNEEYAERFCRLGVSPSRMLISGSIKFDRLQSDRNASGVKSLRSQWQLGDNEIVLMGGSTHSPEEDILLQVWHNLRNDYPELKLILAPRHAERFQEVRELIETSGAAVIARSQGEQLNKSGPTVYLLDTLGELSRCWGLADLAYVGGSLNQRGGQNMMEPAAYGASLLFGPNTWNFAEVVDELKLRQACIEVSNAGDLEQQLRKLLANPARQKELGKAARDYVMSQQGATLATLQEIEDVLHLSRQESLKRVA